MTPTEALARAHARTEPITKEDQAEGKRIAANLAALGYEVRPIEVKRGNIHYDATGRGPTAPIEQAAEAADREAAGKSAGEPSDRLQGDSAAADLDVEALALAVHQTRVSNESPEYDMDLARERAKRMIVNLDHQRESRAAYAAAMKERT